MNVFLRWFCSIVLSFTIIVTGAPFQLFLQAQAQQADTSLEVTEDTTSNHKQSIEELRQSIIDPARNSSHLDPFLMLKQVVADTRREKVEAVIEQVREEDFQERLNNLVNKILDLEKMQEKLAAKIDLTKNEEQRTELKMIEVDIQSRLTLAQKEYEDLQQFDPKKGNGLPIEHMVDESLSKRHYWGNKLRVLVKRGDVTVYTGKQEAFTQSLSPNFNSKNFIYEGSEDLTFEITDKKGRVLHKFLTPVEGITFYGNFLVFVESHSMDKAGEYLPLRFIDLNYVRPNMGNAPLPVFTMPLKMKELPKTFEISKGYLQVGEQRLSYPQMQMLSQLNQIIFNVNVALLDPSTYENVRPLIAEILVFFEKAMKSQDALFQEQLLKAIESTPYLKGITDSLKDVKSPSEQNSDPKDFTKKATTAQEAIQKIMQQQSVTEANQALRSGRGFVARTRMLMMYLQQPRVEGAPKIFNSLVILATGSSEDRKRVLEFSKDSFLFKLAKYGAATAGVILVGQQLPEPYTLHLYKSLDLISAIGQHFKGYLEYINYGEAYVELSKHAFVKSTTGWTYFPSSYLTEGKWPQFLYGISSVLMILLKLFTTVHVGVNSYKLLLDTLEFKRLSNKEIGFIEAFKKASASGHKLYYDDLSKAEKHVSGSDVEKLNAEDIKLLEDHIRRLEGGREDLSALERDIERGYIKNKVSLKAFLKQAIGFVKLHKFGEKMKGLFEKSASRLNLTGGEGTLRGALAESFLSYSSLRNTFRFNALSWNYFFIARNFAWDPAKWLMVVVYPNYFNVALSNEKAPQHFPSEFNRGLELWPQKIYRRLSTVISHTGFSQSKLASVFIGQEALENLKNFENAIMPMELAAVELAKKKAQIALIENIKDPQRLIEIFDSSQGKMGASTGITKLYDKKLKRLTSKERTFYRAYFTKTYDLVMQHMLTELSNTELKPGLESKEFAAQFKAKVADGDTSLNKTVSSKELLSVIKLAEAKIDFKAIGEWSNEVTSSFTKVGTRLKTKFRHRLLGSIHSENYQIQRFTTVREKVKDPRSMERAMRMEVSSLVSAIPMGLASSLALYAGVQTGILQPFDASGWDTNTHFHYMSRYLFYAGFIPGVVIGMLANTWMKLQEDHRIDQLGGFSKVIKEADAKKGFWRYYLKNVFRNPVNKWKDNQIYYLKLVTANIPAAAITAGVSDWFGLGRFDIGTFLASFLVIYLTPMIGYNIKTQQAFELASSWVYDRIPRYLRAHERAQKYINMKIQSKKVFLNFFENIWSIVIDQNIAGSMLVLQDNVKYGTRAFLRITFGGYTPTQLIDNFLNAAMKALQGVPGAETALGGLRHIFTNKYEAFEAFTPELLKQAKEAGVKIVTENPNLPKNLAGEIIGKTAAAATFFGTFATLPYAAAKRHQLKTEKKIQAEGRKILNKQDLVEAMGKIKKVGPIRCQEVFVTN